MENLTTPTQFPAERCSGTSMASTEVLATRGLFKVRKHVCQPTVVSTQINSQVKSTSTCHVRSSHEGVRIQWVWLPSFRGPTCLPPHPISSPFLPLSTLNVVLPVVAAILGPLLHEPSQLPCPMTARRHSPMVFHWQQPENELNHQNRIRLLLSFYMHAAIISMIVAAE